MYKREEDVYKTRFVEALKDYALRYLKMKQFPKVRDIEIDVYLFREYVRNAGGIGRVNFV